MSESQAEGAKKKGSEEELKAVEPIGETATEEPKTGENIVKESPIVNTDVPTKEDKEEDENPPSLPQRKVAPATSESKDEGSDKNPIFEQLKDAFPNMESKFIKAVIIASQGALDPAFNALLYLSDPESGKDIELPKEPIATEAPQLPARRKQTQLEQDEMLARQLDEQFNRTHQRPRRSRRANAEREAQKQRLRDRQRRDNQPLSPEEQRLLDGEDEDSWSQFMERELPELRERANRSIQDTATKLNGWISGIRRNFVGEEPQETPDSRQAGGYYGDPYSRQREEELYDEKTPKKPERRRFNSFGAQVQDDSLESHGITLRNDEADDEADEEDDIPPQIGGQKSQDSAAQKPAGEEKVVAQTTYIDTPDNATRKKWQPLPPEPLNETPTKTAPRPEKGAKNADEDEFLINSEDEM